MDSFERSQGVSAGNCFCVGRGDCSFAVGEGVGSQRAVGEESGSGFVGLGS
jgi:hypothetical protein